MIDDIRNFSAAERWMGVLLTFAVLVLFWIFLAVLCVVFIPLTILGPAVGSDFYHEKRIR